MPGSLQLLHPLSVRRWSNADLDRAWAKLVGQVSDRHIHSYQDLPAVLYVNTRTLELEYLRRRTQESLF